MTEGQLMDAVRLVLGSEPAGCWWRNNIGTAQLHGHTVRFGVGNPGGADLIGVYRGRFVAVEIKTATGRQSPEQRQWQQLVESKGGLYVLNRSVDDARELLARLRTESAR